MLSGYKYNAEPYGDNSYNENIYNTEAEENNIYSTVNEYIHNENRDIYRDKHIKHSFFNTTSNNNYNTEGFCGYEDNLLISNLYEGMPENYNEYAVSENNMNMPYNILHEYINVCGSMENTGGITDFYYDFEDNVNNFGDKTAFTEEKPEFIHNFNSFSENADSYDYSCINKTNNKSDYSYIRKAADNYSTNNYSSSGININMGGITQNITEGNCENVMDMLVESLMRGLSCKGTGVY